MGIKAINQLFIPTELEVEEEDLEGLVDLEEVSREHPQAEEAFTEPADQPAEVRN